MHPLAGVLQLILHIGFECPKTLKPIIIIVNTIHNSSATLYSSTVAKLSVLNLQDLYHFQKVLERTDRSVDLAYGCLHLILLHSLVHVGRQLVRY